MLLLMMTTLHAFAGYGDIIEVPEAYPSWAERDVHIWTNMMRVDPNAFFGPGNDWGGPCEISDFLDDETLAKAPLYYDFDLNDAGRFHSTDMRENDWFSHSSSDGTSFGDRMQRFYVESGYIGENIAMGYPNGQSALIDAWMCSDGHRANIMNGDFNELGVGTDSIYFTQDFAAGIINTTSPIAMGNHSPQTPVDMVDFWVDFQGGTPEVLEVVVNGHGHPVELTFGAPFQGIYMASLLVDTPCIEYFFRWSMGEESGTFPETQSYLAGFCETPGSFIERQLVIDEPEPEEKFSGCQYLNSKRALQGQWGLLSMFFGLIWVRQRS